MARTVVVDVRKAVVAGIRGALELYSEFAGVSCQYGYSASDDERREVVYTSRARATHDPASMRPGRNFRDERMEFEVTVLVRSPVDSHDENDERAADIGQVIEEFIADRKSGEGLGLEGVLNWITVTNLQTDNLIAPTGSMSIWQYTVAYQARLT